MKLSGIRVPAGYVVGVVLIALAHPKPRSIGIGLAIAALGETMRLWAAGHIEKTERLATGGPYAHTRNPLYVGSSLLALGAAVAAWNPIVVAAVVLYFAIFYPVVIAEEARFLRAKFAGAYETWARDVPAFIPRLRPAGPRESRFSWARVRRNHEWRAALALPLLGLLMYLRARF
jgi:protein-S-isoprenylcysteine O-methyltransferase Ste14